MHMCYCVLVILFALFNVTLFNVTLPVDQRSSDQRSHRKKITVVTYEIIQRLRNVDVPSKVMDKLNRLDNEAFKNEFIQLHMRAKLLYLVSLNIDQHEQFLRRFEGDKEWDIYCKQLVDEERCFFPSWTKQMTLIRDCYYKYYLSSLFCSVFAEKKNDHPTDIACWKEYYHTNNSTRLDSYPFAKEVLMNISFQRKKLKMLNLP